MVAARSSSFALLLAAAVVAVPLCAQGGAPTEVLQRLSLEQRAGQLFVSWIRADADAKERARIAAFVHDVGLGGVILSLGTVDQAVSVVEQMQGAANVPLLVAGDFEGGVAFRLQGATQMGNQMLVGATGLTRLARAMGEVTGREAAAIGAPWVLAPVLDVNCNPSNPIINVRSFGEDAATVARFGAAFVAGVQDGGKAFACGKHFPGHGDVDSDSHLDLPTVPGSGDLLRARELVPFRVAANASKLASIMTGHLSVPGLGEDPAVPATLSSRILEDVLRDELGFRGLVVTDALDMGGVKNKIEPGEVAVRALLAGADVLLMPPDPVAARDAVVAAVRSGRVPAARLDDAVLRLLAAKNELGLVGNGPHGAAADWKERVSSATSASVADEIAERGLVLVRDARGLVPIEGTEPWCLLTVRDKEILGGGTPEGDRSFPDALRAAGLALRSELEIAGDSPAADVTRIAAALRREPRVLVAMHVKVRSHAGRIGLPPSLAPVLASVAAVPVAVGVSFGSPYLATELPDSAAFLCAFASTERTANAVARALRGSTPITGRLPVRVPGVAAAGSGLTVLPGRELTAARPEDEGFPADLDVRIRGVLSQGVADRVTPGAVCVVVRRGRVVAEVAVGAHTYDSGAEAVTPSTPYDLASLTKVCATTPAMLVLAARGTLSLDDPVQTWLPEFVGVGKERVTIRHLLAHTAGLPAYERYYRTWSGKDAIVAAAAKEGLMTEPGQKATYSDLGLVLAMAVVERASGKPFDEFVAEAVFAPLGMDGARFRRADAPLVSAPPTEQNEERGGLVRGAVHDENAFAMGGVSGHAGLFATARDVAKLGVAMLARGRTATLAPMVAAALVPQTQVGSERLVGFDVLARGSFAGAHVLTGTFGHTGFTGTSLVCDPVRDVCVVLLTNRVHPTRVNGRIHELRQRLHDCVLGSVE